MAGAGCATSAIRPRSAAVLTGDVCVTAMRWLGPSRNPPAVTDTASRVDETTSWSVTPFAQAIGIDEYLQLPIALPPDGHVGHASTAINRGRTVHRARVVKSICESEDDDMPTFMTRLREESGDMITGGRAAAGSVGATRARRSWTSCRADAFGAVLEDEDDRRQATRTWNGGRRDLAPRSWPLRVAR